jgi:hypothetical protein
VSLASNDASLLIGVLADARLPGGSNAATVASKATTTSVTTEAAAARLAETKINGITITGIPTIGQVPTAISAAASTWQTPTTGGGTALPIVSQSSAGLPADWDLCLSAASFLQTPAMGTMGVLGIAGGYGFEVEYQGVSPVVANDGLITCAPAAGATQYRSEVVFGCEGSQGLSDYDSIARFYWTEGQRIRIAFDVMTTALDQQTGVNWNSIFQSIGKSTDASWPFSCISINTEPGVWIIQGGAALTPWEITPRKIHADGTWYRWELDILLGRAGTGSVSIWLDGALVADAYKPPSGTYYAGTGNAAIDLQYLYFKNGLYGAATTSPAPPKALFRNRRFSVTQTDGTTTSTWRGPQTSGPGMRIFRRNPTTGMAY